MGSGLAGLEGINAGDRVTEAQMQALFVVLGARDARPSLRGHPWEPSLLFPVVRE